jgi:hypothetical protein
MALTPKRIMLQLPKNETDIAFIRSLQYARWDRNTFSWLVTPTPTNQELIRRFFGTRLEEVHLPTVDIEENKPKKVVPALIVKKDTLLIIHFMKGRVRLIFPYEPALVKLIKTFPFPKWDQENKWWSVALTPFIAEELKRFCQMKKWVLEEKQDERIKLRKHAREPQPAYLKEVPESFVAKLTLRRYSYQTIKSYMNWFVRLYPSECYTREDVVF